MNGFFLVIDKADSVESAKLENLVSNHNHNYSYIKSSEKHFFQFFYKYEFQYGFKIEPYLFSNLCLNNSLASYPEAVSAIKNVQNNERDFDKEYKPDGSYLFENESGEIVLATDFLGMEQIYLYQDDDVLILSTRLRILLGFLQKNKKKLYLNKDSVISYLAGRESKRPHTFIESISILNSSSVYKYSKGVFSLNYEYSIQLNKVDKADFNDKLYEAVYDTLNNLQNYKVINSLSGGVDSQSLALVMKSVGLTNSISVGYKNATKSDNQDNYDETDLASEFSEKHNLNLSRLILDASKTSDFLDPLFDIYDRPAHDITSFYHMSKAASESGNEIIVSGMGGDAFFSSKINRKIAQFAYSYIPFNLRRFFTFVLEKILGNRGFVNILNNDFKFDKETKSFLEIIMRGYSSGCLESLKKYCDHFEQATYEKNILSRASDFQNRFINYDNHMKYHLLAIEDNPDEYHALTSASLNNIRMVMPFTRRKFVSLAYSNIKGLIKGGRKLQKDIFSSQEDYVLNSVKSGFSTPYDSLLEHVGCREAVKMVDKKLIEFLNIELSSLDYDIYKSIDDSRVLIKLIRISNYVKANEISY